MTRLPSTVSYAASATEAQLVNQLVTGLQLLGYVVLQTGQWRADKAGNSCGLPDLLVTRPGWKVWYGLEAKTAHGKVRREQQMYADRGFISIVRSLEDCLAVLKEAGA